MKGQFMLISSIVIGLTLISTASTVSEIQSRSPNINSIAHDINYVKSEIQQTDLDDPNERNNLEEMLKSHSSYNTQFKYWDEQNCLNLTFSNERNRFEMSCIGNTSIIGSEIRSLFEIVSKNDFDTQGNFKATSAGLSDNSGNLGLGYRNGDSGDDLVGYWRFDRDSGWVLDYSGKKNNGSNNGADRTVSGVFSTDSVYFPDNSDVIKVSHNDSLAAMSELTVSAWIKEDEDPGTNYAHIVSKSAESVGTGDNDYGIIQQSDRDITFRVNTDGNYNENPAVGNPPVKGEWMHVVGTWDGSEIRLYQNGVLVDTVTSSGSLNNANGPLGLGRHPENTDKRYFDGSLDEVRIYQRALTSSEVKRLYFNGDSGEFRGNYTSNSNEIDTGFNVSKLQVDSDIVSGTSSTVEIEHSSGEERTVVLEDDYKNYSLPFSNKGGDIDITVNLNSTDEENSPIIRNLRIWGMN